MSDIDIRGTYPWPGITFFTPRKEVRRKVWDKEVEMYVERSVPEPWTERILGAIEGYRRQVLDETGGRRPDDRWFPALRFTHEIYRDLIRDLDFTNAYLKYVNPSDLEGSTIKRIFGCPVYVHYPAGQRRGSIPAYDDPGSSIRG